ncbi:MAG: hypothetical protein QXR48_04525 [Candidatus Woesearchaeota archaeon]
MEETPVPVISEVLVRNNRLLITLKDLGTIYHEWQHHFPTKTLTPEQHKHVMKEFAAYNPKEFDRIPKFNIIQITAGTGLPDKLKKTNPKLHALFDKYFVTGHYTPQARWRTTVPWRTAEPDPRIIIILKEKRESEKLLKEAIESAQAALRNSEVAKKRRITNHEEYVAEHWNTLDSIIQDNTTIQKKKQADNERNRLERRLNELLGEGIVETNPKDKSYDIILKNNYIKPVRQLTAEEILNGRICILDIEKPLFNTPEEEISWVATILLDKGKTIKKTIHTLRNTGTSTIGSWIVEKHNTEAEIVEAVRKEITATDENGRSVDAVVAYHAPYDNENLKEAGDYEVGERETDPKVEVAMSFFRKLRIHGRMIIDPLPAARIRYKHLPNRKFELVLAEAQGIQAAKIINYNQLAQLEKASKTGNTTVLTLDTIQIIERETNKKISELTNLPEACAQIEAKYVSSDVDHLHEMLYSKWFRDFLTDACWISQTYNVELSRILHSTKTINDAQEKCYFDFVGTYRDVVYQKFKQMIRLEQEGRQQVWEKIAKWMVKKQEEGIQKNLHKIYLPIGLWLSRHVAGISEKNNQTRFLEVKKLVDYAQQFKNDKQRYFTINQYLDALADYITVDFGLLDKARTEYEKLLHETGIPRKEFEAEYNRIRRNLSPLAKALQNSRIPHAEFRQVYQHFREKMRNESEWGYKHLLRGTLTKNGISRHMDNQTKEFLDKHNLDEEKFAELLKLVPFENKAIQKAGEISQSLLEKQVTDETRQLMARYEVPHEKFMQLIRAYAAIEKKARKLSGQYNVTEQAIRNTLNTRLAEAMKFLSSNGFRPVHAQGGFIYVAGGNPEILEKPDAPVICIDHIPVAYIAPNPADPIKRTFASEPRHKIFYPKHNYYEGIKVTDRPTHHLTMLEMRCYAPLISLIIQQKYKEALQHANDCLEELRNIIKEKEEDIKKWQQICEGTNAVVDTENYDEFLTMPKTDLVWHTKTTDRYRAFENGQTIHFVTDESKANGMELRTDPETGRKYFEEPARKNSEKCKKVYMMQLSELRPDIKMIYERIQSRIRDFIQPLVGYWDSFKLVEKTHKNPEKFLKQTDILDFFSQ